MRIISRAEWGAQYASAYQNRNAPLPAQGVVLHQSVTLAPDLVPPFSDDYQAVRTLESIGQSRFGWGISYTNLVTPAGLVFEGHRIGGQGTHTGGMNDTHRGICLIGNYSQMAPTDIQEFNTAALLVHGYRSGWWRYPELLGGHRDFKSTECPGNIAYNRIDDINRTARDIFMADSEMVQDLAWRVHDYVQAHTVQTGGPGKDDSLPMVQHMLALVWRVEALVNGHTEIQGGPTEGTPVVLNRTLNEINDKLDQLLSR